MTTPRERVAVFPGSFDPITNGHLDIDTIKALALGNELAALKVADEALRASEARLQQAERGCGGNPLGRLHDDERQRRDAADRATQEGAQSEDVGPGIDGRVGPQLLGGGEANARRRLKVS